MSNSLLASQAAERHLRHQALKIVTSVPSEVTVRGYYLTDVHQKDDKFARSLRQLADIACDHALLTTAMLDEDYLCGHQQYLTIKKELDVYMQVDHELRLNTGAAVTPVEMETLLSQPVVTQVEDGLSAQCSNVVVSPVAQSAKYGTQHSKQLLMHCESRASRVVVSTANCVVEEQERMTQGHYQLDVPLQCEEERQARVRWRERLFGADYDVDCIPCAPPPVDSVDVSSSALHPMLLSLQWNQAQVLELELETPGLEQYITTALQDALSIANTNFHLHLKNFLHCLYSRSQTSAIDLDLHDYSASLGCLVSTVSDVCLSKYGRHGISRTHQLVCDARLCSSEEPGPVILQASSIGHYSAFKQLAEALTLHDKESVPVSAKSVVERAPTKLTRFVWPSVDQVVKSKYGINAMQPLLAFMGLPYGPIYRWKGYFGREPYLPHIKTFHQLGSQANHLIWSMLTSSNLSIGAWGSVKKNAPNSLAKLIHEKDTQFKQNSDELLLDKTYHRKLDQYHFSKKPQHITGAKAIPRVLPVLDGVKNKDRLDSLRKMTVLNRFYYLHAVFSQTEPERRRASVLELLPHPPTHKYHVSAEDTGHHDGIYTMNNFELGVFFSQNVTAALFRAAYRGHFHADLLLNGPPGGYSLEQHAFTVHNTTYHGQQAQWIQAFMKAHPTFPKDSLSLSLLPLIATPKLDVILTQSNDNTIFSPSAPVPSTETLHIHHSLPIPFQLNPPMYPTQPAAKEDIPFTQENVFQYASFKNT